MLAQLDVMMGGRVAEEMIFGDDHVTTGAADDLKRATELAMNMVKQFGLSDKVGLRDFSVGDHNAIVNVNELSPQTTELIDQEIARLLKESYDRARKILTEKAVSQLGTLLKIILLERASSAGRSVVGVRDVEFGGNQDTLQKRQT